MSARSSSLAKDPKRLFELNRARLKKIFGRLHPSKDGRISFVDVTHFCRQSRLYPVCPIQDFVSTQDLREMLEKLRPNYPTSSITLSYLQFEQMLSRIAQSLSNATSECRVQTLLEHIQLHCGTYYAISFVYSAKGSPSGSFRLEEKKGRYKQLSLSRRYAESPHMPVSRSPSKFSPMNTSLKGLEANPQLRRPANQFRNSFANRHRSLSKEGDVSKTSEEAGWSEGLMSRLSLPGPDSPYLRSITETFETFRAKYELISERNKPAGKPVRTQIRRYQDYLALVRGNTFSQELVKRLILQTWRLEVMRTRKGS